MLQPTLKKTTAQQQHVQPMLDPYLDKSEVVLLVTALLKTLKDATFYQTVRNETGRSSSMIAARATLRELVDSIDTTSGVAAENLHGLLRFMLYQLDTADRRQSLIVTRELIAMLQPILQVLEAANQEDFDVNPADTFLSVSQLDPTFGRARGAAQ